MSENPTVSAPIISAKGISKKFPYPDEVEVLRNIDVDIPSGQTVAIMGPSGEGKSTLLHILGTLEAPTTGTLQLAGHPVTQSRVPMVRNKLIGFVFQSFHLLEDYSTIENVLMPARIARKPTGKRSESYGRALMLLERVGLKARTHFPVKLLSGGEKQRASIARALMNDPPLLLADEPSGNLDEFNSQAIHQLLLELVNEERKTLITVTHDMSLASLCDVCYLLKGGFLQQMELSR